MSTPINPLRSLINEQFLHQTLIDAGQAVPHGMDPYTFNQWVMRMTCDALVARLEAAGVTFPTK